MTDPVTDGLREMAMDAEAAGMKISADLLRKTADRLDGLVERHQPISEVQPPEIVTITTNGICISTVMPPMPTGLPRGRYEYVVASKLADLEAKAVVLAQAASAVMAEYACGGHVGPTAEISTALSKAIEPFAELIARTKAAP